ncbi:hypothetical protein E2C01_016552 [Portunus trituberculatus]|uniref:Uncharacterized protein n=1 Tax=Portunus trituberculatus TaxID=210409 RepID=A0A5B7DPE3_PORTR|nr:hypothetical protein [Portunus trituberculatus]
MNSRAGHFRTLVRTSAPPYLRTTKRGAEKLTKSVNYRSIDDDGLTNVLQELAPPDFAVDSVTVDVDKAVTEGFRTIMDTAATFTLPLSEMQHEWDETCPRWKNLLNSKDSKPVWKSINWKGGVEQERTNQPKDFSKAYDKSSPDEANRASQGFGMW